MPKALKLLFLGRMLRLFGYGLLAVILALYLAALGCSEVQIGLLLTLTLVGGAVLSILISARADRLGRRRMLQLGAVMMIAGGLIMGGTDVFWLLVLGAVIGVISPTGGEVGPFLAIEQACFSQVVADGERTRIFAWSHVTGFVANACGALVGGLLFQWLEHQEWTPLEAYRALLWVYAACGLGLLAIFSRLGREVELPNRISAPPSPQARSWHGLHRSRGHVLKLSLLFTLDATGGGFVVQSFVAYWFHQRFQADPEVLGRLFFATNFLSGVSALAAVPLARRFGLLNTMVFTHLPSNLLLMLVPFMPSLTWAVAMLLARHLIAQMDVPTRQSYVNAIVPPDERSAANSITTTVRQFGTAAGPVIAGPLLAVPGLAAWCFVIGGGLKCVYDLLIWRSFRLIKPPEEIRR